jgi:hypothetical protein
VSAQKRLAPKVETPVHTLVDPRTLTPPLKPFRICYEDGPWVKCDTSTVTSRDYEPAGELSCGTVCLASTEIGNATRWYANLLLVERDPAPLPRSFLRVAPGAVQERRGAWPGG